MKITFLWIGASKYQEYQKLIDLFKKRLKHYCKFEVICLKEIKHNKTSIELKKKEGNLFLSHVAPKDHLILLDETGKMVTSRELAKKVQQHMNQSQSIVFLIGGAYGVSQELFDRADTVLSLSKMTLTHDMARLLLVEQVYRALTILRGEKYHND